MDCWGKSSLPTSEVDNARGVSAVPACDLCDKENRHQSVKNCLVCHMLAGDNKSHTLHRKNVRGANGYAKTSAWAEAKAKTKFVHCDPAHFPMKAGVRLCGQKECFSSNFRKYKANKGRRDEKRRGERLHVDGAAPPQVWEKTGNCDACGEDLTNTPKVRMAGQHYEQWEHYFRTGYAKTKHKKLDRICSSSRVCNKCYCSWGYDLRVLEGPRAVSTSGVKGSASYSMAADDLEKTRRVLEEQLAQEQADRTKAFLGRELLELDFRVHVLRECLAANKPMTDTELVDVLRQMFDRRGTSIAPESNEEWGRLKRTVEKNIVTLKELVNVRVKRGRRVSDGRFRPMTVFPAVEYDTQLLGMLEYFQDRVDSLQNHIADLKKAADEKDKALSQASLADEDVVKCSAHLLKVATRDYALESSKHVSQQRTGEKDLESIDPAEEYNNNTPPLLRLFVGTLSRWVDDGEEDPAVEARRIGPKCLMAGVLACWAHKRAWCKNANAMAIFLRENGTRRAALDYLARNLGITSTDSGLYRLTQTMVKEERKKAAEGTLIPKRPDIAIFSLDNINLKHGSHYAKTSEVDLIGGIGHHFTELSPSHIPGKDEARRAVADLADLGFEGHFGRENPEVKKKMLAVATASVASIGVQKYDGLDDEDRRKEGDFEVRVARKLISKGSTASSLGADNRRIGQNVVQTYIDVEERSTKKLHVIMPYLDKIGERASVGKPGGRSKVVVVGDQEVWKHLRDAVKQYPEKYGWVVPWPGDWHLMLHSVDVIFRKWGTMGLLNMAKAAGCCDAKLEGGNYHKRHFLVMAVTEALWQFCLGELESIGEINDPPPSNKCQRTVKGWKGNMATPRPGSGVWKAYEEHRNIELFRQNKRVQKVEFIPPRQPPAQPARNQAKELGGRVPSGNHNVARKVPEAARNWPELAIENARPRPIPPNHFRRPLVQPSHPVSPPPVSRAEKAKQWSRKRNKQGKEYFINRVTGAWQYDTPECLKKYPRYL